jgi:cell division protein FtsB
MAKPVAQWTDARLDDLAAALAPVPAEVAALRASVDYLSDENRALRAELAAMERQLLQIAWGLAAALIGAAAALAAALL